MGSAAFFKARLVGWVPSAKTFQNQYNIYKKMSKMGPEKISSRFWDIVGCQVQNDLKTLGNRFLGRDPNFLKNVACLK